LFNQVKADADSFVTVGRIRTVFGVKGWLKVEVFAEDIQTLVSQKTWLLSMQAWTTPGANGKNRLTFTQVELADWKLNEKYLLVLFKGLDNREEARQFGQHYIHLPSDQLPDLADDEVYWHQLEGMQVFNLPGQATPEADAQESNMNALYEQAQLLGQVDYLLETGANDVLVVKSQSEQGQQNDELMIPYLFGHAIIDVDIDNKRLLTRWFIED